MFAFTTSPEQQKYVTALRAFVAQEITPIALEHDRLGTTPLHVYANFCGEGFSEPFFRGDDAPRPPYLVTFCLAGEELGYGCAATASLITLSIFLNRLVLTLVGDPTRSELRRCLAAKPVVTSYSRARLFGCVPTPPAAPPSPSTARRKLPELRAYVVSRKPSAGTLTTIE